MDWRDQLRDLGDRLNLSEGVERLKRLTLRLAGSENSSRYARAIGGFAEKTGTFIRRQDSYTWGKAATIVICTYYLSDLTTLLVEELVPKSPDRLKRRSSFVSGEALSDYETIFSRNLFSSKGLIPEVEKPSTPSPDGPAVKTTLPFNLLGTIVLEDGLRSVATIQDKSATKTYPVRVTDEIPTKARITKIESRRVTFVNLRNRRAEYVELPEDVKAPKIQAAAPKKTEVTEVGESRFNISRSEIEKTLANLNEVLTQALARPVTENGKPAGYRITQIVKGSIYDKLGLRDGDILKGFDGQPISDPMSAWDKLSDLKNLNQVELNIKRNGQDQTLVYDIL